MADAWDNRDHEELSVPEKILRVQDLWDEIARTPQQVHLTPVQRDEAERRLIEHERNPGECSSWEDVRRRLEGGR
jgi:putative addiction module component (TIGR02574 family)